MFNKLKPKSDFSSNVLTLMTGTSIAQAIPVAISPILTRLYNPEDFGIFALYMTIVSLLSIVFTGRYELAIMLPKKDEDAINIMALAILISLFISVITFLVIFIFNTQITNLLGNSEISMWLYLIPVSVLLSGLYKSFYYWNNRKKQYKYLATSKVIQSGTTGVTNISMGLTSMESSGLIFGSLAGQSVATFNLGKIIFKHDRKRVVHIKRLKILALMKKYIKFPTWNLGAGFIHTGRENIIQLFFYKYFSTSFLGFYFFSNRILRTPSVILINAFSEVFFQKLSQITCNDEMYTLSFNYAKKIFFILIIPYILFVFSLEKIVPVVFGENWSELYLYLYIMSFPIFFNIIVSHFSKILIVTNKQEFSFYFHLIKFIMLICIIALLYVFKLFSFDGLIIISIFEILWIAAGVILIKKVLRIDQKIYLIYILTGLFIYFEYLIYIHKVV